jgi:hypothetical protein
MRVSEDVNTFRLFLVYLISRSIAQNIQCQITETQDRGRYIAGIAGSNLADGMDVRLLCLLCVVYMTPAKNWSLVQRNPTGCTRLCGI